MTGVSHFMYIAAVKEIEKLKAELNKIEKVADNTALLTEIDKLTKENKMLAGEIKVLQAELAGGSIPTPKQKRNTQST